MWLHIWSSLVPKEQTLQGWLQGPSPSWARSEEVPKKRKLQEIRLPPLLLPNSVNLVQTWPQILWETLNSKEVAGCKLSHALQNTNIGLGNRKSEGWTSGTFTWVPGHRGMNERKNPISCLSCLWHLITHKWNPWDASPRVELSSEGHTK